MLRFTIFTLSSGVFAEKAAPMQVKVNNAEELDAPRAAITNIVDRVVADMAKERTSFLSKGVDSRVKDGLFITQPLRSDEQVRVNVIEKEPRISNAARTVAAASAGAHLRARFNADLAQLRSSFVRFSDIATRNAGAPAEVINFSIESGVPSALAARRSAANKYSSMMAIEEKHHSRIGPLLE